MPLPQVSEAGDIPISISLVDDDSEYPGVGHAVRTILAGTSEQDTFENLHRRANEHLKVFDDPRYTLLDTPLWVARLFPQQEKTVRGTTRFTVRNVVKAMYDTAEDLGLDRLGSGGGRYVAAAICACAADASEAAAKAEEKDLGEALARGLQRLASTWAAFLLWPFYAHGWQEKRVFYPEGRPSGLTTPPWFSKGSALLDENLRKHPQNGNNRTLEDKVFPRDGYRCVLSGFVDRRHYERLRRAGCTDLPEGYRDNLEPANFFKRSLAVYSSPSGSQSGRDEFDSMAVTLEILQHYCGLDRKHVDDVGLMDAPKNAITVLPHFQKRFEYHTLCLKPTLIPHCYDVKDYEPGFNHLDLYRVPAQIVFKSQSQTSEGLLTTAAVPITREPSTSSPGEPEPFQASSQRLPIGSPQESERGATAVMMDVEPPDPALVRLHAALTSVLHLSGAFKAFDSIFLPLEHSGHSAYPAPGGSAFWRSVVEYEGAESCVEVELREAVCALRRGVGGEKSLARAARSVE